MNAIRPAADLARLRPDARRADFRFEFLGRGERFLRFFSVFFFTSSTPDTFRGRTGQIT